MTAVSAKPESSKTQASTIELSDVLRILGSIAGFVGIASALLWLFGRFYYSGLFTALGFPSLLVSLAPEDYLEQGYARLVFFIIDVFIGIMLYYLAYLAKVLYQENIRKRIKNRLINFALILLIFSVSIVSGVFLISIQGLGLFTSYFFENPVNILAILIIFIGLEVTFLIASPVENQNNYQNIQRKIIIAPETPIVVARVLISVVIFASLLATQAHASFVSGQGEGCRIILRKSPSVVIYSTDPILAEGQSQIGNLYEYSGYFLLFTDKNNYYLFREIDPQNYEPTNYFVVNRGTLKTIQFTKHSSTPEDDKNYNRTCVQKINE